MTMIQGTPNQLKIASRIVRSFQADLTPADLISRINALPYYPKTLLNSLSSFTNQRWLEKDNCIKPVKDCQSWYKPIFNLKRQSLFIEYSQSVGLNPYVVHPNLRTVAFPKAPVPLPKKNKEKRFQLDNIEELKVKSREKRRNAKKTVKSPLEGRIK